MGIKVEHIWALRCYEVMRSRRSSTCDSDGLRHSKQCCEGLIVGWRYSINAKASANQYQCRMEGLAVECCIFKELILVDIRPIARNIYSKVVAASIST